MTYNPETTIILFENENKEIFICNPTGELPVEVVAIRDLPAGTPYWIKEFSSTQEKLNVLKQYDTFFSAYELDKDVLGHPHGIALGFTEWARQQPEGTLGL